MKLFNTLTKSVGDFSPIKDNQVGIYSCGPTVYDHIHIGNLASFIYADTLRRVLVAAGYKVKHVMNFTDVDDKTIKKSQEQSHKSPMEALKATTSQYEKLFIDDMCKIGNDTEVLKFIKATESIDDMQRLITKLYEDGFAYVTEDGVYFSIEAYRKSGKAYGQLANIDISSTSHARIDNDEYDKESVHDFALWKVKKADEPAWDFKLGSKVLDGRPGWHIECSAMSTKLLGQPFDIHTGGIDLIFPHHENEIAQSTAGQNKSYAQLFFHNEHLLVDGKKMSKSLKNFFTLDDIISKGYDPLAFRLLVLQSHYRKPVNFTWETLDEAQDLLNELKNWASLIFQIESLPKPKTSVLESFGQKIAASLGSDLNVPVALTLVKELATRCREDGISRPDLTNALESVDSIFGLDLLQQPDITKAQYELIQKREDARIAGDYKKSDDIRAQLQGQGISISDTDNGPIWSRI